MFFSRKLVPFTTSLVVAVLYTMSWFRTMVGVGITVATETAFSSRFDPPWNLSSVRYLKKEEGGGGQRNGGVRHRL